MNEKRHYLTIDDTSPDGSDKYHVGFLTPELDDAKYQSMYRKFAKINALTIKNINEVVALFNDILQAYGEVFKFDFNSEKLKNFKSAKNIFDIENKKLKNIKEVHMNDISNYIGNIKEGIGLYDKNASIDKSKLTAIRNKYNNPYFDKLFDILLSNDIKDAGSFRNQLLDSTSFLIRKQLCGYVKNTVEIANSFDVKVMDSAMSVDNKILSSIDSSKELEQNGRTRFVDRFKENIPNTDNGQRENQKKYKKEALSLLSLIQKTLLCTKKGPYNVSFVCDNNNMIQNKRFTLYNENGHKFEANFQDSRDNIMLQVADMYAWIDNRYKMTMSGQRKYDIDFVEFFEAFIKPTYSTSYLNMSIHKKTNGKAKNK